MTDCELLKAAAKAAGYAVSFQPHHYVGRWKPSAQKTQVFWDPLGVNGDAFDLAGRLKINIEHVQTMGGSDFCISAYPIGRGDCSAQEEIYEGQNIQRAMRRAIVRAAASLEDKP